MLSKNVNKFLQLLERTLEVSGNDLDSAIKSLNDLQLGAADFNLVSGVSKSENGAEMNAQLPTEGILAFQSALPYTTSSFGC